MTNPATVRIELFPKEKLPKILASPGKSGLIRYIGSSGKSSLPLFISLDIMLTSPESGEQFAILLKKQTTVYNINTIT
jgi:hypothetical protein